MKAVASGITHPTSRNPLLNVCVTSCLESINGWSAVLQHIPFDKNVQIIIYGGNDFPQYNDGWTAEDKKNALAHLKCVESFEFIYCMITISCCLMHLKEAVVKIQGKHMDNVEGVSTVMECRDELKEIGQDVDAFQTGFMNILDELLKLQR